MSCFGTKNSSKVNDYRSPPSKSRDLQPSRVDDQNQTPKNAQNNPSKLSQNQNDNSIQKFLASLKLIVNSELIEHQKNRINQKFKFPASFKKAKVHLRATKFGYNSDSVPPEQLKSKSKSEIHESSKQRDGRPKVCPCCSQKINTVDIDICYHTTNPENSQEAVKNLSNDPQNEFQLNSSSSLFFSFIKMAILYFFIMFLLCGIFNILTSLDGNYCAKHSENSMVSGAKAAAGELCTKSLWQLLSTFNKHQDKRLKIMIKVQNIICLAAVVLSIVFFTCYKNIRYQIYSKIDSKLHTQDDYTIFVENIPILDFKKEMNVEQMSENNFTYENNLRQIFQKTILDWISWMKETNNLEGQIEKDFNQIIQSKTEPKSLVDLLEKQSQIKVTSISLCFNLSGINRIDNQRQNLMNKHIELAKKQNKDEPNQTVNQEEYVLNERDFETRIQALNQIELNLCKKFAEDDSPAFNITHFVGKAFVSFEYQHYREHIMQKYEDGSKKFMYQGNQLILTRASNPTDIKWINMEISDGERFKRVITSYLIIIMVLVFSAAALIFIDLVKMNAIKQGKEETEIKIMNYSLTILGSVLTMLINYGISNLIKVLSGYEKHQTFTNKIASQIIKTIIAQFINSVLILYLIQVFNSRPYLSSAGLVVQASTYIVVSGFTSIFINAINIPRWWRIFNLWWKYGYVTQEGAKQNDEAQTYQVALNRDFQLPVFDITQRYIWYLLQIYTCMFYCYLVPVGMLATAVIFGIQYWIDKVNLLKFSSEYKNLGYFLSRSIFKVFECSLLIFTVGNLIFAYKIQGEDQIDLFNIISLGIALIYSCVAIFATPSLERKLFGKFEGFENLSYSECIAEQKFNETYWTENPGTMFAKEIDWRTNKPIEIWEDQYFQDQDIDGNIA